MKNDRIKRTDTHRPSVINPLEYEWVAFELIPIGRFGGDILGDCEFLRVERDRIRRHMETTKGTYSNHTHGGNCMVCGCVNAVYTVLFYHKLTNSYVRMGQDCAQKCEMAMGGNFDAFKTAALDAMKLRAGKRKAEAILTKAGLSKAWPIYLAAVESNQHFVSNQERADNERFGIQLQQTEEEIVADIVSKIVKYGSFSSERQEKFVRSLLDRIDRRSEILAARKAQHDAAKDLPVPEGRISVEGIVLSVKSKGTPYGIVNKMVVRHNDGWKVYGTCPSKMQINKGDRIRFSAAIEPSKDDPKFGFFSRPTKTEIIPAAA